MAYNRKTGGTKEFHYNKEDMERIQNEDTDSTREFKETYHNWRKTGRKPKKHFHDVNQNHKREFVGRRKEVKKDPFYGIKRYFRKIKRRLNSRNSYSFRDWDGLFYTCLLLILATVAVFFTYKNITRLNEINFLFFRIGSVILLGLLFAWLKLVWNLWKKLKQLYKRSRNWVKYLVVIVVILILFLAYKGSIEIIDPVVNKYDSVDKNVLNPFVFGKGTNQTFNGFVGDENIEAVTDVFIIEPEREEECKDAFDYVNTLRKKHGKKPIKWNDDIYRLAVDRCKDMYDNNYFDHTSPSGECPANMKKDYGLSRYTLAENIGAMNYGSSFATSIDPHEQVDGWMDSRGHRYNLLYTDHVVGAIGCYYGFCAFIGGHTSTWGLGAGGCSTGAEGEAYWDSAGKQPGEV